MFDICSYIFCAFCCLHVMVVVSVLSPWIILRSLSSISVNQTWKAMKWYVFCLFLYACKNFVFVFDFLQYCFNFQRIPTLFWEKVANLFPNSVKLFFRNGFNLWVGYDNFEGVFTGVEKIYQEFGLKKGDTLLFEYVSMYNFRVFIIGAHFSEIQYPLVNSGPSREGIFCCICLVLWATFAFCIIDVS